MDGNLILTASDLVIGAGVLGLYGYLYRINRTIGIQMERVAIRVDCLQAVHLARHPEDQELLDRICGTDPLIGRE
jgi:hypothetical protein